MPNELVQDSQLITPQTFLAQFRAQYPEYNNDEDDQQLLNLILDQYPQYKSDLTTTDLTSPAAGLPIPRGQPTEVRPPAAIRAPGSDREQWDVKLKGFWSRLQEGWTETKRRDQEIEEKYGTAKSIMPGDARNDVAYISAPILQVLSAEPDDNIWEAGAKNLSLLALMPPYMAASFIDAPKQTTKEVALFFEKIGTNWAKMITAPTSPQASIERTESVAEFKQDPLFHLLPPLMAGVKGVKGIKQNDIKVWSEVLAEDIAIAIEKYPGARDALKKNVEQLDFFDKPEKIIIGPPPPDMTPVMQRMSEVAKELPPDISRPVVSPVAESEIKGIQGEMFKFDPKVESIDLPAGLTTPQMKPELYETIIRVGEDLIEQGYVSPRKDVMIHDTILEAISSKQIPDTVLLDIAKKNNISIPELSTAFDQVVASHASALGRLGQTRKRFQELIDADPNNKALIEQLGEVDQSMIRAKTTWKRLNNIRRGLLVTQLSTAMRNAESQVARVGLDVFDAAADGILQKIFTPEAQRTVGPLDGFKTIMEVFRRGTKKDVEAILKAFPKQADELFNSYASDVAYEMRKAGRTPKNPKERALQGAENYVHAWNTINRAQEFIFRRAVFRSKLAQSLEKKGMNLDEIIVKNEVGEIPLADVKAAVNQSLEMTFAKSPEYGTLMYKFVDIVNSTPLSLVYPFPRFLYNALKFNFEYSPLGFGRLITKANRKKIAEGNFEVIAKATTGSALFITAWQMRKSDKAGERWYEWRTDDGKTIDLRPFNPFAAYLFVADVMIRKQNGMPAPSIKDITMGVLGTGLRAGTGLYALDKILEITYGEGDPKKVHRILSESTGELAGGLSVHWRTLSDFVAEFDETQRVVRDKRTESPLTSPFMSNLPYGGSSLPPYHLPTRSEPLTREEPALRQLTGLSIRAEKNTMEKELDRLGYEKYRYFPSSGEPYYDQLLAKETGKIIEESSILPILEGETLLPPQALSKMFRISPSDIRQEFNVKGNEGISYKDLSNAQQTELLRFMWMDIREEGREKVEANAVTDQDEEVLTILRRLKVKRMPKIQRRMLRDFGVQLY